MDAEEVSSPRGASSSNKRARPGMLPQAPAMRAGPFQDLHTQVLFSLEPNCHGILGEDVRPCQWVTRLIYVNLGNVFIFLAQRGSQRDSATKPRVARNELP